MHLTGRLEELGPLRHTPAGIPAIEFLVLHESTQSEAGQPRRAECEMACVLLGAEARLLLEAQLGDSVAVQGFLAARSLKRRTPVLHVNKIEFLEGFENGIQTEQQTQG